MSVATSVVLHDVCFTWPDGAPALTDLSGSFGRGSTGLVGANGTGKSTLLRLIAGELRPSAGVITAYGSVDHLPQDVSRRGAVTVADLLGIADVRAAVLAVERGSTDPRDFDVIGLDWDVDQRARAMLDGLGLPDDLDRTVSTLSGGEAMLTAIAGVQLRGADIALLDEPTNNLDGEARARLYDVVRGWRGTLVVASHDVELLDLLDATAELRGGGITAFGGPYDEYRSWVRAQQEAALRTLRSAEQELKRERRERIKTEERISHSERKGRKDRANRRYVGAVVNDRRNSAERSQGAKRGLADAKIEVARAAVAGAEHAVRDDDRITVDLPDPAGPRGRFVAEIADLQGLTHVLQGPERVALVGRNGVGKTRLLEELVPRVRVRVGYLPQRIVLDDRATVLELMAVAAPDLPTTELRNRLARLLLRGPMVERPVGSLSGGERFRVALATLVLADPPPELLVLDEPTNDLDLDSVDQLVDALTAYRGAVLVVSHDERFLERVGVERVVELRGGARGFEARR